MKKLPALLLSFFLALSFAITSAKTGAQEAALPLYIDSEAGFLGMSHDGVYRLSQDITLTRSWESGDMAFCGTLDGGGHTVTLSGVPMFVLFSGTLKNVKIEGSVGEAGAACQSFTKLKSCRPLLCQHTRQAGDCFRSGRRFYQCRAGEPLARGIPARVFGSIIY